MKILKLLMIIFALNNLYMPKTASKEPNQYQNESNFNIKNEEDRKGVLFDSYIIGAGDILEIEILEIPELSGRFGIGPDGTTYLPRLRNVYVEGLTINELNSFLTESYKKYLKDPELYIRPIKYRPIKIYISGEVAIPGFYTLNITNSLDKTIAADENNPNSSANSENYSSLTLDGGFPTVFDAIRKAGGITPFSDLSNVKVKRRLPSSSGNNKIQTSLNFLSVILEGDESQNLRLKDGDIINISKSSKIINEQLQKASQTNLSPRFIDVYISGAVTDRGKTTLPTGATLRDAILVAGGAKPFPLRGKVEFVRFRKEGDIERKLISISSIHNKKNNPVLISGDLIRIRRGPVGTATTILNEVTSPAIGVFSIYNLFNLGNN